MTARDANNQTIVLHGSVASWGVGVGRAMLLDREGPAIPRRHISADEVVRERSRLTRGMHESVADIQGIRDELLSSSKDSEAREEQRLVLDAHLLMHGDEIFAMRAKELIERERINAEWAIRRTVDSMRQTLESSSSPYFRERARDIEHVGQHILRRLLEAEHPFPAIEASSIIVADELSPADAALLMREPICGIITASGSETSHTAVLARAASIPAVVGVGGVREFVEADDWLVVDGLSGQVIVRATEEDRQGARERAKRFFDYRQTLEKRPGEDGTTSTLDGERVELYANVDLPSEATAATANAKGIGLYRTEFLFLGRQSTLDEDEQYAIYREALESIAPKPVVFRTFDLGGDKLPLAEREAQGPNPALGLRALRLLLARPQLFTVQLRALLRAACHGNACVMFPMVSSLQELRAAKQLLNRCREELERDGIAFGPIRVGSMIEVPSAALRAEALASECDFFAVGTNDLVQYTLALDRGNPKVAHLARPLEPAVLELLARARQAASNKDIPIAICGEMASHPIAMPIALGLGYRRFSLPAPALPLVREWITRINAAQAEQLALRALDCVSADEVETMAYKELRDSLSPLWQAHGISLKG